MGFCDSQVGIDRYLSQPSNANCKAVSDTFAFDRPEEMKEGHDPVFREPSRSRLKAEIKLSPIHTENEETAMKTSKTFPIKAAESFNLRKPSLCGVSLALYAAVTIALAATAPTTFAAETGQTAATPVAYVYVGGDDITAYSAASNGKLTSIPGSPFTGSVSYLAGNGKFLFGSTASSTDIETYEVESNGALRYVASENAVSPDGGCGEAGEIFTDHSGETLYDMAYFGNQCSNNTFEQFSVNQSTGKLSYLGIEGNDNQINGRLSFTKNNLFAYSADCFRTMPSIYGFRRNSNGKLTQLNINPAIPDAPENDAYCPWLAESDPFNHLAVTLQALDENQNLVGPNVLAIYTVSSSGSLTTGSTTKNMPAVEVGENINAMTASPAGNLLAVAGSGGLQVFHFNGASPITHFTGLLTSAAVDQIFWDNNNHLYAISGAVNKLWVFTVTPTGYSQAPGSPYSVNAPQGLRVMTIAE